MREERRTRLAPRGRHVRDQQLVIRIAPEQRIDQRLRRARLAHRHRMQPDERLQIAARRVRAEALAEMTPIAGLATRTPQQVHEQPRHRQVPGDRVEPSCHVARKPPVS